MPRCGLGEPGRRLFVLPTSRDHRPVCVVVTAAVHAVATVADAVMWTGRARSSVVRFADVPGPPTGLRRGDCCRMPQHTMRATSSEVQTGRHWPRDRTYSVRFRTGTATRFTLCRRLSGIGTVAQPPSIQESDFVVVATTTAAAAAAPGSRLVLLLLLLLLLLRRHFVFFDLRSDEITR
jgi:hypothetical protein